MQITGNLDDFIADTSNRMLNSATLAEVIQVYVSAVQAGLRSSSEESVVRYLASCGYDDILDQYVEGWREVIEQESAPESAPSQDA